MRKGVIKFVFSWIKYLQYEYNKIDTIRLTKITYNLSSIYKMEHTSQYNQEFYIMIKQILYTRIFLEYRFTKNPQFDNPILWNKIFAKYNKYIHYFILLRNKMELQQIKANTIRGHFPSQTIFEEENPMLFSYKSNQYSIYETETFQEYVDKLVKPMSTQEYGTFIQNMLNAKFKESVIKRHERAQYEIAIKHNIIYIMQLQINPKKYSYTRKQQRYLRQEMHQELNLAPYFKYLSKEETDKYKCNQSCQTEFDLVDYAKFQYYEEFAIQLIKSHI